MKDMAIRFLWKAPIERIFIGASLIAIFFLWRKSETIENKYRTQLIQCSKTKDSLQTYYNTIIEQELEERIARYDSFIQNIKLKKHEKQ